MKRNFILTIIITLLLVACGQNLEEQTNTVINGDRSDDHDAVEGLTDEENSETSETATHSLDDLIVHYIDVGQADATLFQFTYDEKPFNILYDAGDWNKNDVINYLDEQDITFIDLIIISHPHADHTGQLADVIHTFGVGEVWLSGNTSTSQTFQDGLEAVLESGADYYEPRTGDEFDIGPLKIDVLHPSSISGNFNEESISLLFTYGAIKFVFTGDAGKDEELKMIDNNIDIEADFLHLGHHGSKTSTDPAFIKAVNPEIAIYSAGMNNSYGHPHAEVVSRIQDAGITLYGTDVHGTIIVKTNGNDYNILTQIDGTISPKSTGSTNQTETVDEEIVQPEKEASTLDNCIDINQAPANEVQKIIHIGPERAQDLIDLRPFDSVDDLDSIKGIGAARIANIKSEGLACVK